MRDLSNTKYTRIRKDVARRLFEEGRTIYLVPRNVIPDEGNMWIQPYKLKKELSFIDDITFDWYVNSFEYYNCNHELGYYSAYYINEEGEEE